MELYRVRHLLANLGWVDFDMGCSTILPTCSATSASFLSARIEQGRGRNSTNQSQPNPGYQEMPNPVMHRYLLNCDLQAKLRKSISALVDAQ